MKKLVLLFAVVFFTTGLNAQNVIPGGKETIKIKGFVGTSMFLQDQQFKFGNGQNAEWANPTGFPDNKWFSGFDVRNTRLTFVFNGAETSTDWKLGGAVEMDFFGGEFGTSLFSAQMPMLRLRLAYADIVHNNLRIRMGQAWTPMFGNVPVSVSHIAFPLGYGSAGFVGWRFPGIYFYQGLNGKESSVKIRMDAALFSGSWNGPGSNTNFLNAGNFGIPQMELKFNFIAKSWSAYVVGHYDQKDLTPVTSTTDFGKLTGTAVELGAKFHTGGFLFQGNFYSGKNIGQQFGAITQVQDTALDLRSTGGWLQLGYVFNKKLGVYGFLGDENVNRDDAIALFGSPRTKHFLTNFMVDYKIGSMTLAVEWLQSNLTYATPDPVDYKDKTVIGNQISMSCLYKF